MNEIVIAIILWLAYLAISGIISLLSTKQALVAEELIEKRGMEPDLAAQARKVEYLGALFLGFPIYVLYFLLTIYTIWAVVKAIQYIF